MEEPKSTAKRGAKTAAAAQEDRITLLPLSELHDFPNHPFKVRDDEAMQETAESIRQYGVLVPAIVRPREDGGYEIIAGHRRRHGSELAGLSAMPCIVRQMDDDTATILMVDSNIQRENILPSERAQAYKMKLEAIRRKAGRPAKEAEIPKIPSKPIETFFGRKVMDFPPSTAQIGYNSRRRGTGIGRARRGGGTREKEAADLPSAPSRTSLCPAGGTFWRKRSAEHRYDPTRIY